MSISESVPEPETATQPPDQTGTSSESSPTGSLVLPGLFSPTQLVAHLSAVRRTQPVAALAAANQHREALTEPFLQAIERGVADPVENFAKDGMLFNYSAYFLAKWREPRAYPLFIRWLSLPGENALELGGDTVTQHGARFLASVCGGDIEPLRKLILNREAHVTCRAQALAALCVLVAWGERARPDVEDYFLFLAREGLEREGTAIWVYLAGLCIGVEMRSVYPEVRRAIEAGFIPSANLSLAELDLVEKSEPGSSFQTFVRAHPPITDVIQETRWWAGFQRTGNPSVRPDGALSKAGRNDPCPCGSGKKFKKCCGR